MWMLLLAAAASAAPSLSERLAEIEPLRAQRISPDVPAIPASAYESAGEGVETGLQAVEGERARKAWGVTIIDVPIAQYWAAINDDASKTDYTALEHIAILDGAYCAPLRTVFQYLPVSWVSDRWWVARITANTDLMEASEGRVREMRWESIDADLAAHPEAQTWAEKGISTAFTKGAWLLVDLDGERTLVEYYAWTDPGGRVPAGMASRFAAGGIEDTLEAMGRLAATGPACPLE